MDIEFIKKNVIVRRSRRFGSFSKGLKLFNIKLLNLYTCENMASKSTVVVFCGISIVSPKRDCMFIVLAKFYHYIHKKCASDQIQKNCFITESLSS